MRLGCLCLPAHIATRHPQAAVTVFGEGFVRAFYRFVERSDVDFLFVERDGGEVVGGCVLSLAPQSLFGRLLRNVPLGVLAASILTVKPVIYVLKKAIKGIGADKRATAQFEHLPEVLYIFASPQSRGKGVGTALLAQNEAFLKGRGIDRYVVKTWDDEAHPTVRFYLKNGFDLADVIEGSDKPLRYMQKHL